MRSNVKPRRRDQRDFSLELTCSKESVYLRNSLIKSRLYLF